MCTDYDDRGNISFGSTYTKSGFTADTPTYGTPSFAISLMGQMTNAKSVKELAGDSIAVGGSFGDYAGGAFVGADFVCKDPKDWIIGKEGGLTAGYPPVEYHEAVTRTVATQVATWNVLTPFIPPVKPLKIR